jgi:hypothetical protein
MAGRGTSGTRFNYQYDCLDRKSQEIKLNWINGIWENGYITDYSYPGLDELNFEALTRIPDGGAPLGLLCKRSTQTGTALQTIKVDEYHNTGNWMAHLIATSNYSNDGQILSYVEDRWNVVNSNWNVEYKVESTYNPNKSIHQHILYQRSETFDTLYVWYIFDYDYGNYPVSVHPAIGEARVSLFPNPTSDFVQVALEGKEIYNITLSDLHGKVLARTSTANTANISLAGHAAGVYLLHIEQDGAVQVIPVVKI